MFNYLKYIYFYIFILLVPSACTTVEVYSYQYDSTLDEVFVKQGVDFSRYNAIMVDDVGVLYPDDHAPAPENLEKSLENLALAQSLFRQTIADALPDSFTLTDQPGRNVLRLHVEFVDLRAVNNAADIPRDLDRFEFRTQPGHITMIGQLFDAATGEQLARAADLGKQQSAGGNGVVDWNAIAEDFEYWADVFTAWMDRNSQ